MTNTKQIVYISKRRTNEKKTGILSIIQQAPLRMRIKLKLSQLKRILKSQPPKLPISFKMKIWLTVNCEFQKKLSERTRQKTSTVFFVCNIIQKSLDQEIQGFSCVIQNRPGHLSVINHKTAQISCLCTCNRPLSAVSIPSLTCSRTRPNLNYKRITTGKMKEQSS
jgi:hypothetical protein